MDDQGIRKDPLPTPDPIGLMWLKEFEATAWRTMDKVVRMKKANDRETALIFEAMQSFMREIRVSVACADIRLMDGPYEGGRNT